MARHGPTLTLRPAEAVPEKATVRHVDQLSEGELEAVADMADGEKRRTPGLQPGDVVVFTSYYRVVAAERGGVDSTVAGTAADGGSPVRGRR
ncbi:hypothetical protein [Halobaculum sp. D14]|uniref:hypothetical protein n=1 Tax=unclassified Halobaculum TaxID=2640896 RepID=UPI003EBB1AB3